MLNSMSDIDQSIETNSLALLSSLSESQESNHDDQFVGGTGKKKPRKLCVVRFLSEGVFAFNNPRAITIAARARKKTKQTKS